MHRALLVILLVSGPILGCAQGETATPAAAPAASSVRGVWKISNIVATGANAATNSSPQPGLVIFTEGHYSYVSVNGSAPRPDVALATDPAKLTDAEKLARFEQWNPFTAQSGTYQIDGTTLTRRPLVAKNTAVMTTNPPIVSAFTLNGDTLVLVTKSAAGQPVTETRTTLTRVE